MKSKGDGGGWDCVSSALIRGKGAVAPNDLQWNSRCIHRTEALTLSLTFFLSSYLPAIATRGVVTVSTAGSAHWSRLGERWCFSPRVLPVKEHQQQMGRKAKHFNTALIWKQVFFLDAFCSHGLLFANRPFNNCTILSWLTGLSSKTHEHEPGT